MRIVVTALGCLLLAGCAATVGELEAKGPIKEFVTPQTREAVADCIFLKWREQKIAGSASNVAKQETSQGLYVSILDTQGPVEFARIRSVSDGTQVSYFQQDYIMATWRKEMRMAGIDACM
ncbi:hypothetical protein [Bordetella bronchiseptica]|uniref:hypothetical protein n=1 Tax=Bordetella bronchiseptica TaxID=518 RepID=UPI00052908CA|nr:hypothetical protein [Bordetella bronchiseptica]